jgi:SanA protein
MLRSKNLGIRLAVFIEWHYGPKIFSPEAAPSGGTAIVFGAGLRRDGSPTAVLADRVTVASQLYLDNKVEGILMSGSNNTSGHNEPEAMRDLAIELGVPPEAILLDSQGLRTFDTCQRAKQVFALEKVLLVSQAFHLPRALVTCDALGLDAVAATADLRNYSPRAMQYWKLREIPATLVAIWDIVKSLGTTSEPWRSGELFQEFEYES